MAYDVRCFPTNDSAFATAVRDCIERLSSGDDVDLDGIAEELRATYPDVLFRLGDPMASVSPVLTIVYALRDGEFSISEAPATSS